MAQEFARRLGNAEEEAFLTGTGTDRPSGILVDTAGASDGSTAVSATAITFDDLISCTIRSVNRTASRLHCCCMKAPSRPSGS